MSMKTMPMKLFTGNANPELATRVAENVGVPLSDIIVGRFNDGEIQVEIKDNVRDADVFLIQSFNARNGSSLNDHIMELLVMVDACRRASAGRITAVIPYYAYGRQERKAKPRVPITAALVADLLQAVKVHRVLAFDLHAGAIQGFFNGPVDHLGAAPVLRDYVKALGLKDVTVVSPDAGGAPRAETFRKYLLSEGVDSALTIMSKQRGGAGVVEKVTLIGEVQGKDCILIDDIIDTAGTLVKAAEVLVQQGAKSVYAMATHGLFSRDAIDKIRGSVLKKVIITDTIPLPPEKRDEKIVQITISNLLAEAIKRTHLGQSISQLFS
jgi:ribose-phosphate pyrophosphokinase